MDHTPISEGELDRLLAERDPIDTGRLDALPLEESLGALLASVGGLEQTRPRRRRARRSTRLSVGFGVAVTAVVAASLWGFGVFGSSGALLPGVQLPAAQAAELSEIAAVTAGGPSAGHGKWLYLNLVRSRTAGQILPSGAVISYRVTEAEQIWTASAHGPTRIRETFTHFAFSSRRSHELYVQNRRVLRGSLAPLPLKPGRSAILDVVVRTRIGSLSPTDIGNGGNVPLSTLPQGPVQLVRLLGNNALKGFSFETKTSAERAAARIDVAIQRALSEWIGLGEILTASTSASQRAEAYRALTLVRFVDVIGRRRDRAGRAGIAICFQPPGSTPETLIVDPKTGDLLQADGTTLWLARGTVDSDSRLPDGKTVPLPAPASRTDRVEALRNHLPSLLG